MIDLSYKGKTVYMPLEKFGKRVASFEVKVVDAKMSYGRLRFLVEPISGTVGKFEFWIDAKGLEKK
jgi:hypothetical protein